jgi:hypothetical protein
VNERKNRGFIILVELYVEYKWPIFLRSFTLRIGHRINVLMPFFV